MLSNETVHKLREMHLGVMAGAFSAQLDDAQFQTVSFEDRFAMRNRQIPQRVAKGGKVCHTIGVQGSTP